MDIIEGKKFPACALATAVNVGRFLDQVEIPREDPDKTKFLRIREVLGRKIAGSSGETVETSLFEIDRILRS